MSVHRILPLLAVLALLAGCASTQANQHSGPERSTAAPEASAGSDALRSYRSVREPDAAAGPASVSIPAIGVKGPLTKTGIEKDRTLQVPEFGKMSWYTGSAKPGDPGPAAILGHVDTREGPDVFYRLHELSRGDRIVVGTRDGDKLTFVVDRLEQHRKDRFPTEKVWLPGSEPQLRLITCGGDFDRAERSYRDNIIVFASLQD